jgi:Zn-dependent protease
MAILQLVAVLFNLVPIPPLDGFGVIRPYMDAASRQRLSSPPVSTVLFFAFFLVLWKVPHLVSDVFNHVVVPLLQALGYRYREIDFFRRCYNTALYSTSD